jgi:hypothetical protein
MTDRDNTSVGAVGHDARHHHTNHDVKDSETVYAASYFVPLHALRVNRAGSAVITVDRL